MIIIYTVNLMKLSFNLYIIFKINIKGTPNAQRAKNTKQ